MFSATELDFQLLITVGFVFVTPSFYLFSVVAFEFITIFFKVILFCFKLFATEEYVAFAQTVRIMR